MTYTNRKLETLTVAKRESKGDWHAITGSSGWTAGCSKEVYDLLPVGKEYTLETRNFSQIAGWSIDGQWHDRKSDEDFDREHAEFVADLRKRDRESLDENRADWAAREDALPEWLRARLRTFHEKGGETFQLEGWGYELTVCEVAALYAEMGPEILDKTSSTIIDSAAVTAYATERGTSGNQHGMALAMAKAHLSDPTTTMAGTVSALSPITGNAFYEPAPA